MPLPLRYAMSMRTSMVHDVILELLPVRTVPESLLGKNIGFFRLFRLFKKRVDVLILSVHTMESLKRFNMFVVWGLAFKGFHNTHDSWQRGLLRAVAKGIQKRRGVV